MKCCAYNNTTYHIYNVLEIITNCLDQCGGWVQKELLRWFFFVSTVLGFIKDDSGFWLCAFALYFFNERMYTLQFYLDPVEINASSLAVKCLENSTNFRNLLDWQSTWCSCWPSYVGLLQPEHNSAVFAVLHIAGGCISLLYVIKRYICNYCLLWLHMQK